VQKSPEQPSLEAAQTSGGPQTQRHHDDADKGDGQHRTTDQHPRQDEAGGVGQGAAHHQVQELVVGAGGEGLVQNPLADRLGPFGPLLGHHDHQFLAPQADANVGVIRLDRH
jgi:hypothetical protein